MSLSESIQQRLVGAMRTDCEPNDEALIFGRHDSYGSVTVSHFNPPDGIEGGPQIELEFSRLFFQQTVPVTRLISDFRRKFAEFLSEIGVAPVD